MTQYLWLIKILGVLAILGTLSYGVHKYNDHFRDEGRAEVHAQWDASNLVIKKMKLAREDANRKAESEAAVRANTISNTLYKESQDEVTQANNSRAAVHADTSKLRYVTSVCSPAPGLPGPSADSKGTRPEAESSYSTQLPAEIGDSFRQLEETAISVGSEANLQAKKLLACEEFLVSDRLTCGVIH